MVDGSQYPWLSGSFCGQKEKTCDACSFFVHQRPEGAGITYVHREANIRRIYAKAVCLYICGIVGGRYNSEMAANFFFMSRKEAKQAQHEERS